MAQTRSQEQRFSLAISLKNLKENKTFIVLVLGVLSLLGLYLGYPLMIKEGSGSDIPNFSFLNELFQPSLNISHVNKGALTDSQSQNDDKIKWGFASTSSACAEDHIVSLSSGVYLSVCNYKGNIIVDIRKFMGNEKIGITPTIVGIGLNINQWYAVTSHINIIKQYINDLS